MGESMPENATWRARVDERFTSLRGFAALTVVLAHYQYIGFVPGLPLFKFSGQLALMLFFFLSAFLLAHSLAQDPEWPMRTLIAVARYAINRIARIFPLLLIVVTLSYCAGVGFFSQSTSYLEAVRLTFTLGKAPSVLWTIPVELTFYVFLPFILKLMLFLTRTKWGAALACACFVAWCVDIALARSLSLPPAFWMTLGFHHYANSFVGGVLLYALLHNRHVAFPRAGAAIAYLAPVAFLASYPFIHYAVIGRESDLMGLGNTSAWQAYYDRIFPFAPLMVGGIVYALLLPYETPLSVMLRARFLRGSGEASFGVYLAHIPMIDLIGSRFGYGTWQFVAALVATFAAARVLSRRIEKPVIALGHELGRGLHARFARGADGSGGGPTAAAAKQAALPQCRVNSGRSPSVFMNAASRIRPSGQGPCPLAASSPPAKPASIISAPQSAASAATAS